MPRGARGPQSLRLVPGRSSASDRRSSPANRSRRPASGAGAARIEGVAPPGEEVAEQVADGLAAVPEVLGDPGDGPSGVGEGEHLDAVAGGVVEVDAAYTGIVE